MILHHIYSDGRIDSYEVDRLPKPGETIEVLSKPPTPQWLINWIALHYNKQEADDTKTKEIAVDLHNRSKFLNNL